MRGGLKGIDTSTTDSMDSSAILVGLLLVIGATVFLRRAGYMRRNTFYTLIAIEVIGVAVEAYLIHQAA